MIPTARLNTNLRRLLIVTVTNVTKCDIQLGWLQLMVADAKCGLRLGLSTTAAEPDPSISHPALSLSLSARCILDAWMRVVESMAESYWVNDFTSMQRLVWGQKKLR